LPFVSSHLYIDIDLSNRSQFHSCFTLKVYSLALKFLFSSSKNLQSIHQDFNIKVRDVINLSSSQEAKEKKTLRQNH